MLHKQHILTVLILCVLLTGSATAAMIPSDTPAREKLNHMSVRFGLESPSNMPGKGYQGFSLDMGYSVASTLDFRIKKLGYLGATVDFSFAGSNYKVNVTQIFWGFEAKFSPSQAPRRLLIRPGVALGQSSVYGLPGKYNHSSLQGRAMLQFAYLYSDRPGYLAEVVWVHNMEEAGLNDVWEPEPYFLFRLGLTF